MSAKHPLWTVFESLQKFLAPLLFQPFHDFAHVLGAVAGDDEQGVGRFDNNEIAYADDGSEFSGHGDEVAVPIDRVSRSDEDVAVCGFVIGQ